LDRSSETLRSPDLKRYQMAPFEVLHEKRVDHASFCVAPPPLIIKEGFYDPRGQCNSHE
jgi:hypothetical protein